MPTLSDIFFQRVLQRRFGWVASNFAEEYPHKPKKFCMWGVCVDPLFAARNALFQDLGIHLEFRVLEFGGFEGLWLRDFKA